MNTLSSVINSEIRETVGLKVGDISESFSPSATQAELIQANAHTDTPAVDVVVDVDIDIDVDAIAVVDVDIDIDVDVDTPHIDQPQ